MLTWIEQDENNLIYVNSENGKIIGRIMNTGNKSSYYSFINSAIIGEFISLDFAKKAIETSDYLKTKHGSITEIKP